MDDKKEKKYLIDNPTLMSEWDWEKNNESGLNPNELTLGSNKKTWWKCTKGHEWEASIAHRKNGRNCPYCSNKKVLKGYNDLQTINPLLSSEWNYEKNGNLKPENFTANSNKKVWWKCKQGHEWKTSIASRNKGVGCPYCSGRNAIKGTNDLATINSKLASKWNYEKNGELKPEDFTVNSDKKVWWKCNKGHEWQATIASRNKGTRCPYCTGNKVLIGYNDLATINPKLASEWDFENNGELKPESFLVGSNKKVWWKCKKGHKWQSTINNRNKGNGCPICNSERNTSLLEYAILYYLKKHGLKTIHAYKGQGYELDVYIPSKKIAIEYDGYFYHKNKTKRDLEKNLRCQKDGIELYRIREGLPSLNDNSIDYIVDKNQKDLGTVIQKVLSEIVGISIDVDLNRDNIEIENLREYTEKENSFLYTNPKLAKEWNYEKNGNLIPEHFLSNSDKKIWWKCEKGHEWQATISNRNNGRGCPICSNRQILIGYNDLSTVNPKLASEWNYDKNDELKPEDFTTGSNKKVWWKCVKGHEWQATINSRNKGSGCPICYKEKRKKVNEKVEE